MITEKDREEDKARALARFQELGKEQVGSMLAHGALPQTWERHAHEWLHAPKRGAYPPLEPIHGTKDL